MTYIIILDRILIKPQLFIFNYFIIDVKNLIVKCFYIIILKQKYTLYFILLTIFSIEKVWNVCLKPSGTWDCAVNGIWIDFNVICIQHIHQVKCIFTATVRHQVHALCTSHRVHPWSLLHAARGIPIATSTTFLCPLIPRRRTAFFLSCCYTLINSRLLPEVKWFLTY